MREAGTEKRHAPEKTEQHVSGGTMGHKKMLTPKVTLLRVEKGCGRMI